MCNFCFSSCGSEEEDTIQPPVVTEEDPSEIAAKKIAAFKDSLCSGVKFVKRVTKSAKFDFTPTYEKVQSQTSYYFSADGTGKKKYIELTDTDRGYLSSVEDFEWSVLGEEKYSIKITPSNATSYRWTNVQIDQHELTSSEISLLREKQVDLKNPDIQSITFYSVSDLYTKKVGYTLFVTPCILTLYYKDGNVSRSVFANTIGRGGPFYDTSQMHFEIGWDEQEELFRHHNAAGENRREPLCVTVGEYDATTDLFVPIENNTKYEFPH